MTLNFPRILKNELFANINFALERLGLFNDTDISFNIKGVYLFTVVLFL